MKKKIVSAIIAFTLLFGISPIYGMDKGFINSDVRSDSVHFIDVPDSHWAKNDIIYFAKMGIISGMGENRFAPQEGVTREQFAKMLVLTFNAPLQSPETPSFTDVKNNRWSYKYVETCKPFLTGYVSPFDGSKTYHPDEFATREDIAVALVKMMGIDPNKNANGISNGSEYSFTDYKDISPHLIPYINTASKLGLIRGYEDGTFKPRKGISRAEAVSLLNRASKRVMDDVKKEDVPKKDISPEKPKKDAMPEKPKKDALPEKPKKNAVPEKNNYVEGELELKTVVVWDEANRSQGTIYIGASLGSTISVDGRAIEQEVKTDNKTYDSRTNSHLKYEFGTYDFSFDSEGEKTVKIVATKGSKSKSTKVRLKYQVAKPIIKVYNFPQVTDKETVQIRGTIEDGIDTNNPYNYNKFKNLSISINGENLRINSFNGEWSKTLTLREGENRFEIVGTNKLGKTTTIVKTISFNAGGPQLEIISCPNTTDKEEVIIRGSVSDTNDNNPKVSINGTDVYTWGGEFNKSFILNEGENSFEIVARNRNGKTTTVNRSISYTVPKPFLEITSCPNTTKESEIIIRGKVSDKNDRNPKVSINGTDVYTWGGEFNKSFTLNEGINDIEIVARNKNGKSTTINKTVNYISE